MKHEETVKKVIYAMPVIGALYLIACIFNNDWWFKIENPTNLEGVVLIFLTIFQAVAILMLLLLYYHTNL